jgi:hypothetical protein
MDDVPAAMCRRFHEILSLEGVHLHFYLSLGSNEQSKSGTKHRLTYQLLIQSTSFHESLYQLLFRVHYTVFILRCWGGSFFSRHDEQVHAAGGSF